MIMCDSIKDSNTFSHYDTLQVSFSSHRDNLSQTEEIDDIVTYINCYWVSKLVSANFRNVTARLLCAWLFIFFIANQTNSTEIKFR